MHDRCRRHPREAVRTPDVPISVEEAQCALSAQRISADLADRSKRVLTHPDGARAQDLTELAVALFRLSAEWLAAADLVTRPCLRSQAYEFYAAGYREFAEAFLVIGAATVADGRSDSWTIPDVARQLLVSANRNVSLGSRRTAQWDARNT